MAYSVNKVSLLGHVGANPQFRTTSFGKDMAFFSLATSESWRDKATGENKEKTEWHNIVVYNAGLVEYIKRSIAKGSKIYLEGQISYKKWTDKNGNEKETASIVVPQFSGSIVLCSANKNSSVEDRFSENTFSDEDCTKDNFIDNDSSDEEQNNLDSEDLPF